MENNKIRIVISAIIILILVAINLAIFISNSKPKEKEQAVVENKTNNVIAEENITKKEEQVESAQSRNDKIVDAKISKLSEADRAKAYFGKFIKAIEENQIENAYKWLNEEYRERYFPDLKTFQEYIEKEFPANKIVVKYDSIERKGEIFVMSVVLNDASNISETAKIRTVVIREKDLNDFTISFAK